MEKIAVEWFYNELKNLIKESELTEMKRERLCCRCEF